MIRASCKVLDAAAKTFAESWRKNHAPETAALDAERVARSLAAQDVRTLISLDGGRTLVPFQGLFEQKAGPLVGYIAVKVAGYWADMFITVNDGDAGPAARHAEAALDALIAAVRPGREFRGTPRQGRRCACGRSSFILSSVKAWATASGYRCTKSPKFSAADRCCIGGGRRLHIAGRYRRRQSRQCSDFGNRA